jgi:hypothetical protein
VSTAIKQEWHQPINDFPLTKRRESYRCALDKSTDLKTNKLAHLVNQNSRTNLSLKNVKKRPFVTTTACQVLGQRTVAH